MLTKEQDKSLQQALKDFIQLGYTSDQPTRELCYCPRINEFFVTTVEEKQQDIIYLVEDNNFPFSYEACIGQSWIDEVKDIINNEPTNFDYPNSIKNHIKNFVKAHILNYPTLYTLFSDFDDLKKAAYLALKYSGAMRFVRNTIAQNHADYHFANKTIYFKNLKSKAITAYEKAKENEEF